MRRVPSPRLLVASAVIAGIVTAAAGVASATTWLASLGAGSSAETQATTLPPSPTGVTASCGTSGSGTIVVSWSSVSKATGYGIYQSGASTGPWTGQGTVTASPWTSPTQTGTFYYEVSAYIGTNWQGSRSTTTAGHTITKSGGKYTCV